MLALYDVFGRYGNFFDHYDTIFGCYDTIFGHFDCCSTVRNYPFFKTFFTQLYAVPILVLTFLYQLWKFILSFFIVYTSSLIVDTDTCLFISNLFLNCFHLVQYTENKNDPLRRQSLSKRHESCEHTSILLYSLNMTFYTIHLNYLS